MSDRCLVRVRCVIVFLHVLLAACSGGSSGDGSSSDNNGGSSGSSSSEPETYSVGGTVTGLVGGVLTIQNNSEDELSVNGDGAFTFDSVVTNGDSYNVTILSQPDDPDQTCNVVNGTGNISSADVTDIAITCTTNTYPINGTVSGLAGSGLVIQNNGEGDFAVDGNGQYTFISVPDGADYNISILSQPSSPDQICSVTNGEGTVDGDQVSGVLVECATVAYQVGGTVSGLTGSGLQLENNGSDDLGITGNGEFAFATALEDGTAYAVDVIHHPSDPHQLCDVSNGNGVVNGDDVMDVLVQCVASFSIGGVVSGLSGSGLVLQNNGGDSLDIESSGGFMFDARQVDMSTYSVEVQIHPDGQACNVQNGAGIIDSSDITDIQVECVNRPELTAYSDIMQVQLTWEAPGEVDIIYSSDPDCDWDNYSTCPDGVMLDGRTGGAVELTAVESGLDSDTAWYFVLVDDTGVRSEVQSARPAPVAFDGTVNTLVASDARIYLGGEFTHAGVATSAAAVTETSSSRLLGPLPVVGGTINAAVADGKGGWYIGGDFQHIGDQPIPYLAHIHADGRLDRDWNSDIDGTVYALAIDDGMLYVGGQFVSPDYRYLTAVDTETGAAKDWASELNSLVRALVVVDDTVYAGGEFFNIDGNSRAQLAAFDAETGALEEWSTSAEFDTVYALAATGGVIYAGGAAARYGQRLAAYDAETGNRLNWNPAIGGGSVLALAALDETLYVGGAFTNAGGEAREYLAAYSTVDNTLTDWNPGADGAVRTLAADGGTIYAGGDFAAVASNTRPRLAAFDAGTGDLDAWDPGAGGGNVYTVAVSGDRTFAGGDFTQVGGAPRARLAALDGDLGTLDGWSPSANGAVNKLTLADNLVYAGGGFTEVNGQVRERLAALAADTGAVQPWDPTVDNDVTSLAVEGDTVYVGGIFYQAAGQERRNFAAFGTGGVLDSWNPEFGAAVHAIAATDGTLFVGGSFNEIGEVSHRRFAAFDTATGVLHDWSPYAGSTVYSLAEAGGVIYVGGSFNEFNSEDRDGLAAVDATTGALQELNVGIVGGLVRALSVADGTLYAGGGFSAAGSETRERLAAVDIATGSLNNWSVEWNNSISNWTTEVWAIAAANDVVYVGGDFKYMGEGLRPGFAVLDPETAELVW